MPVPQTATGRGGENPKAGGRIAVKELGKLTPYLREKGCLQFGRPQRLGTSNCLTKTQVSAKAKADV